MHNKWPSSSYATPSCSTWGQRSYCLGVTHTKKGGGFRSNDNLADLISRIRNGYFRSFEDILVIDSKQNRELLDALISAGYIYNWEVYSGGSFGGPYGPLFNPQGHGNQVSASYGAPTKQLQVKVAWIPIVPFAFLFHVICLHCIADFWILCIGYCNMYADDISVTTLKPDINKKKKCKQCSGAFFLEELKRGPYPKSQFAKKQRKASKFGTEIKPYLVCNTCLKHPECNS